MFTFAPDDAIYQLTWHERAIRVLVLWDRWGFLACHKGEDGFSVYLETEALLRPEKGSSMGQKGDA